MTLRSPFEIWELEPTFLGCELVFYTMALLSLRHAYRQGGRYRWVYASTVLHGLVTECMSYWYPDIDNFWHSQSMVRTAPLPPCPSCRPSWYCHTASPFN